MQTAIVIIIVAVTAFFLSRRFYKTVKKDNAPTCGCGCDGCAPSQKNTCTEIEDKRP